MTSNSKKKTVAVVITWTINRDSRALRTVLSMSKYCNVDIFYIPIHENEKLNFTFPNNVKFYKMKKPKQGFLNFILSKTFFYFQYNYFISEIVSKKKYDVAYLHDLQSSSIGLNLKKKMQCKLIYDVHDLYTETLNQEFPTKMTYRHKFVFLTMRFLATRYEKKIINKSDLVFTVNESCADWLSNKYNKEIFYFRNFPSFKKKIELNNKLYDLTGIGLKKNIIVYVGIFNKGRNLQNIVKSANHLDDKNKIVLIGDGPLKKELIVVAKQNNTLNKKIFFLDFINYNELFYSISSAKIGLMILDPINKSKEYALANKITEYMLCGITPLLSNHIEHKKLDYKEEFTYKIDNYEPKNIAKKINSIFEKENELKIKSNVSRKMFEEFYNWEKEESKFINKFKILLDDCNN